jgi:protein-S-isoprenylcysteine O-methyltransferase Ste14
MKKKRRVYSRNNTILRFGLLFFGISALFFIHDFYTHTYVHFTGSISNVLITGQWHVVILNSLLFISFLVPLSFRRKIDWKEYGLVIAFFVSLFVEMYGLPLTILFVAGALQPASSVELNPVFVLDFLGVEFHFTVPMIYGTVLMILGMAVILTGWHTLYKNVKKEKLVTRGIYSVSRNPQYLGFIMVIIGWIIGWPTVITVIFSFVLIALYVRLCYREQDEISHYKGFKKYRKKVPLIV